MDHLKELESALAGILAKLKEEISTIRSSRPSVDLLENIKVNHYDSWFTIQQLGSLGIEPPRTVKITVWDKNAVGPIMKAIENAKMGFTVSNEDTLIRASLPPLSSERREEFGKLVKKTVEGSRIQVRARRDETIKKLKADEDGGKLNKDQVFKTKEQIQKAVDQTNKDIEAILEKKLKELAE